MRIPADLRHLVAGVGQHAEGQLVLLLGAERPVRGLGADRHQSHAPSGQFGDQLGLVGVERDVAVRAPGAPVEHQDRQPAAERRVEAGRRPVRVEQLGVGQRRAHLDHPRWPPAGGQVGLLAGEGAHDLVGGLGGRGLGETADLLGDRGRHESWAPRRLGIVRTIGSRMRGEWRRRSRSYLPPPYFSGEAEPAGPPMAATRPSKSCTHGLQFDRWAAISG